MGCSNDLTRFTKNPATCKNVKQSASELHDQIKQKIQSSPMFNFNRPIIHKSSIPPILHKKSK